MPRICPISSSAPLPLGAAYILILLSEVEQEQRPSGNEDHDGIVEEADLCDGEGERAHTVYNPILPREGTKNVLHIFRRFSSSRHCSL